MIPKQCIIIGGGSSVRPDRSIAIKNLELWSKISNSFTIGINFIYKWFIPTVLMYKDYDFYYSQQEELNKLPLVVGMNDQKYKNDNYPTISSNVLLVNDSRNYQGKNSLKLGCYSFQLTGLASISFAIGLGCTEIFLLGFDSCAINDYTHFYDECDGTVIWRTRQRNGIGTFYHPKLKKEIYNTGNYNNIRELNEIWFKPFEQCKNQGINIYNVSPLSKINTFKKINYQIFYTQLNKEEYNQQSIRKYIKNIIP